MTVFSMFSTLSKVFEIEKLLFDIINDHMQKTSYCFPRKLQRAKSPTGSD